MQPSPKVFEDHEHKIQVELGVDSEGTPALKLTTWAADGSEISVSVPAGTSEDAQEAFDKINIEHVHPLLQALRGRDTVPAICEVFRLGRSK